MDYPKLTRANLAGDAKALKKHVKNLFDLTGLPLKVITEIVTTEVAVSVSRRDDACIKALVSGLMGSAYDTPFELLDWACTYDSLELATYMLEQGAPLILDGHSVLSSALQQDHYRIGALLIQHGADPLTATDSDFMMIIENGYQSSLEMVSRYIDNDKLDAIEQLAISHHIAIPENISALFNYRRLSGSDHAATPRKRFAL